MAIRYSWALALNGDSTIHAETGIVPHIEVDLTMGDFETDQLYSVINEVYSGKKNKLGPNK